VPHPEDLPGAHLPYKGVDQGCFANAGLSRDDPHLPPALARLRPPLVQLGQFVLAADKERRTAVGSRLGEVKRPR
jgi:hypothetical protein